MALDLEDLSTLSTHMMNIRVGVPLKSLH